MKTIAFVGVVLTVIFGLQGFAPAFEGGTKAVASMNFRPEYRAIEPGPAPVLSYEPWRGSKPVVELLRRFPKPTLSLEKIREETPGASLGTKAVVLFQRGW